MNEKMKIEIWSDIACPYCYIGKKKLEKALLQFDESDNISIIWRSYELEPDLPKGKQDKNYFEHLAEIKGVSVEEAQKSFNDIAAQAKEEGLVFNPQKIITTNTHDALRLIKLANKYNLGSEAEEILFKAYFTDGEDISDKNTLIRLFTQLSIAKAEIERSIDSFEYSEEVKNDITTAEEKLHLEFIPFYLLNNKYKIQGSISTENYIEIIQEAYTDWLENGSHEEITDNENNITTGKSCSIDGTCSL